MGLDTTNYYLRDALVEGGWAESKGQAVRLIAQGAVLVNDKVEVDMDRVVCSHDTITLKRRPKPRPEIPDTTTGRTDENPNYALADSFMEIFGLHRVDAGILAGEGDK